MNKFGFIEEFSITVDPIKLPIPNYNYDQKRYVSSLVATIRTCSDATHNLKHDIHHVLKSGPQKGKEYGASVIYYELSAFLGGWNSAVTNSIKKYDMNSDVDDFTRTLVLSNCFIDTFHTIKTTSDFVGVLLKLDILFLESFIEFLFEHGTQGELYNKKCRRSEKKRFAVVFDLIKTAYNYQSVDREIRNLYDSEYDEWMRDR